jgi:hypothetical protein
LYMKSQVEGARGGLDNFLMSCILTTYEVPEVKTRSKSFNEKVFKISPKSRAIFN